MRLAFERARSLGYPVASFALGVAYHTGNGVPASDRARAFGLYQEAYAQGVAYGALGLARWYADLETKEARVEADVWQQRFTDGLKEAGR